MTPQAHKRSRLTTRLVAAAAALLLGGGGTALIAAGASADGADEDGPAQRGGTAAVASTVSCPDVGDRLRQVPRGAQLPVSRGLAALDRQVAAAYEKMTAGGRGGGTDAVLQQLQQQREKTIGTMADAIGRSAPRPDALLNMSACKVKPTGQSISVGEQQGEGDAQQEQGQEQQQGQEDAQQGQDGAQQGQGDGAQQGQDGDAKLPPGGPSPDDFADILSVQPNAQQPPQGDGASTGTFVSECGTNQEGHFNSDNVIVTPGVSNGAHHTHDYVGNESTDAFSTDESLAASGTTCGNGDLSTYYWPVLRVLDGTSEHKPGAGHDGNVGSVLTPSDVQLTFSGSQAGDVTAMPRFLRIITGDAKAFTNGPANANASWSCVGFEDRQLKDKYPICPDGADVVRTFNFQSCWDGQNTDSANHRTHVAFAQEDGSCPAGFRAIPQLQEKITYDVPAGEQFAVDSFPEQLHKPVTDHGDFINVMPEQLMNEAVDCINSGRDCG
ncbi:DUF1996 domain-containing protein [Streptomyces purpurogeneiscleroticus]|uniref:DUF1996 domain-containing protein n=1 Tax=Streptomyces purpurogeneiscleroticus TaxID=68259 RepID=UPI001CBCC4BA|nr:DUF1996 domain-containing protein [Streptomyces purpurogeneiscleroticus]MBZ4017205.1 hypothetical protein [Streptomyces purpurogeneiscleroticus]